MSTRRQRVTASADKHNSLTFRRRPGSGSLWSPLPPFRCGTGEKLMDFPALWSIDTSSLCWAYAAVLIYIDKDI